MKRLVIGLMILISWTGFTQEIKDPVLDCAKPGITYRKWVVDINHDGIPDALVDEKPTEEQIKSKSDYIKELPDWFRKGEDSTHAFMVYLGRKNGLYVKVGGIEVDASHCYVGYVKQLGRYGLVTIEYDLFADGPRRGAYPPRIGKDDFKKHLYALTFNQDKPIETELTSSFGFGEKNAMEDEYFSSSKLTNVYLQEVTPLPLK
jgi:hypothetical protein